MRRVERLLRAVKARANVERAQLAALDRRRRALLAEAESLMRMAHAPLEPSPDTTGGDLVIYGRAQAALECAAAAVVRRADALRDQKDAQETALRVALRRELGWERISKALAADRRKSVELGQEEAREAVNRTRSTR
ncbi:MAG: hypothetical protein HC850_13175 [Rhodomicrobium sp.]|nr:hypothetical protein [Rhodomicrobium sp.]